MPLKTFSLISLGCFRNTYDSRKLAEEFASRGYVFKEDPACADLLLINTCGFITKAKEESIGAIRAAIELKNKHRVKELLVFGCLVQRYRKELERAFPQVDQWLGVLKDYQPPLPGGKKGMAGYNLVPGHIGFLKICDGCVNKCSYCAIPLIKGPLRSFTKQEVVSQARLMENDGVKELNIIGQDITAWGLDLGGGDDLTGLLKAVLKNTRIPWVRLIYTHPRHITGGLLDLIAGEERICKYIDLPIQHINDRILKLMNRGITKKEIIFLLEKIRKKIPGVCVRTSIITGFPSETENEHKELLEFLRERPFEKLGAFAYSREENTPAYDFSGQVHYAVKERRKKEIMEQQKEISSRVNRGFAGKKVKVLVDGKDGNVFTARTQYDAYEVDGSVFLPKPRRGSLYKTGSFYNVMISDSLEYDLIAGK